MWTWISAMTAWERLVLGSFAAIVGVWIFRHLGLTLVLRRLDILTPDSPRLDPARDDLPHVTALIPAKDEQETLDECLRSVRAQEYPSLEIVVVDDRSTDDTALIAQRHAEEDPRVRLISIEELPPGWTGKTHALHYAVGETAGDWLWFLDADTRHHPRQLSVLMRYARDNRAALASVLPAQRCESFWEMVVQPLAGIVLMRSFQPILVNLDWFPLAFANGQSILVERTAYEAAGGHYAVRDRFVEDIYLAKNVKATGRPIRVAITPELSTVRMYTSLEQGIRGWSRILYDAVGRRVLPLVGKLLEPLIFTRTGQVALVLVPLLWALGVIGGPFAQAMTGLAVAHWILSTTALYRMYKLSGAPTRSALWYPLSLCMTDWILLRAIKMCLTGQVTWRGTAYGPSTPAPTSDDSDDPATIAGSGRERPISASR